MCIVSFFIPNVAVVEAVADACSIRHIFLLIDGFKGQAAFSSTARFQSCLPEQRSSSRRQYDLAGKPYLKFVKWAFFSNNPELVFQLHQWIGRVLSVRLAENNHTLEALLS